MIMKSVLH